MDGDHSEEEGEEAFLADADGNLVDGVVVADLGGGLKILEVAAGMA